MEFNIGDTVYINSIEWAENEGSSMWQFGFAPDMKKYCECKATIKVKTEHLGFHTEYFLDIDNLFWTWSEQMFDEKRTMKEIRKQKLKKIIDNG